MSVMNRWIKSKWADCVSNHTKMTEDAKLWRKKSSSHFPQQRAQDADNSL